MRLTGSTLQYSTIAVAVLAGIATALLWNRVRGPRPLRALARIGMLLGSYAATALAVLISVNIAYGGLIVSVDDLFSDPNAVPARHPHHMTVAQLYLAPHPGTACRPGPVPLPMYCLEDSATGGG
ncbi:hypothetical protein GXW82_30375 [Streptacidiphilus sp. 4-A2]|nr:hypothetical protein [Streptacidiphilus sp. 4-A2]